MTLHPQGHIHLDDVRPGLGTLDYRVYLRESSRVDPDLPLMLEHLPSSEEYAAAAEYRCAVAQLKGVGTI